MIRYRITVSEGTVYGYNLPVHISQYTSVSSWGECHFDIMCISVVNIVARDGWVRWVARERYRGPIAGFVDGAQD